MSVSATGPAYSTADLARRRNALSVLFLFLLAGASILRFNISPQLLDLFIPYTGEDGAFYEKIHIGSYAIFLLFPLVMFSQPITLTGDDIGKFRSLVRFGLVLIGMAVFLVVSGHAGSTVFLVDTYLVAAAAGLIMLALTPDVRRVLGDITLVSLILSALIGLVETITHTRLLPYPYEELTFRPLGLSEHPLALGALCATAMGFVPLTRWKLWVRLLAIAVLTIGCVASGARFALLVAVGEVIVLLMFVPWPQLTKRDERKAKAVVLVGVVVLGAALAALLVAGGLLSRFSDTIFDENFMARISIYNVFALVHWQDIIFGMKASDLIDIVNQQLHLPTIESSVVVLVMLMGLPLAVLFTVVVVRMLFRMLYGAPLASRIGTVAFLLASLSNNTLSAKTPVMTILVMLILGYGPVVPQRPDTKRA